VDAAAHREALSQTVDLRLADLWRELFEIPQERWDADLVGWFLRTAYGQGYCDALRETEPGALYREVADAAATAVSA
jgi:hypothetical protein